MIRAEQFHVQNNVVLVFESGGKQYRMKLLIENGLVIVNELTPQGEGKDRVMFLEEFQEEERIRNSIADKEKKKK